MSMNDIFKEYSDEELEVIDLEKVKSFSKTFIDLALRKNRIKSYASAAVYHDETNWLTFPKLVLQFSLNALWLFIKMKPAGDGMSCIFRKLKEINMDKWLSSWEAIKEANKSLMDFYNACDELTKEKNLPFSVSVAMFKKPRLKDK